MSVVHRVYARLYRGTGKDYEIDPGIPSGVLVRDMLRRSVWLLRGFLRFRSAVFVGPRVSVRAKRRLQLGRMATIDDGCHIDALAPDGVRLGARTKLGARSVVSSTSHLSTLGRGLRIGDDSSCGEACFFGAAGGITIGNDVIMGQLVTFHSQEHVFDDPDEAIRTQGVQSLGIEIGDGTWIGAKATFLDGARVGANCVVAAGAIVRGEHPDRVVLAGVPAKVVRQR